MNYFKSPQNLRRRSLLAPSLLGLWALSVCVLLTLLMAGHLAPFAAAPALASTALYTHKLTGQPKGWQMLHVLAENCLCSESVTKALLERGRDASLAAEGVVLVGNDQNQKSRFEKAGFSFTTLAPDAVYAETGVEAAPTLIVIDDHGVIRYTGGYFQRRERTESLDLKILATVRAGGTSPALPSYGCAFSRRLQIAVDPLGLKYNP